MARQLDDLKRKCRICFYELYQKLRRNKTYLAVFNDLGRGAGRLIAKHRPVGNYLSLAGKPYDLFLAVDTGLEDLYYTRIEAIESAYPVPFMIQDLPPLVLPEVLLKIQPVSLIPCQVFENRGGLKGALVTKGHRKIVLFHCSVCYGNKD